MCGIILAESFDGSPVNNLIMKQFDAQKNRGRQGFGYFDKTRSVLVRQPKEKKMLKRLRNSPSTSILFHHRYPTSTDNVKNACHPFSTQDFFKTNYVLVHNGHISNARALKREHEKLGIVYHSEQPDGRFNDSEALLWDVALYLEGKQEELEAYGGIAFICMALPKDKRHSSKLYFGRNTNPLNLVFEDNGIMLSSEGEGIETKRDILYSYNYRSGKLEEKELTVPTWAKYNQSNYRASQRSNTAPPARTAVAHVTEHYDPDWDWKKELAKYADEDKLVGMVNEGASGIVTNKDFMLLPEDEDFSYEAVMGEDVIELIFENNQGQMQEIKSLVGDKVDQYLERTDGRYNAAYQELRRDIKIYQKMLLDDEEMEREQDDDLILELDLLTAAKETLVTSPFWISPESIDPQFQDWITDGVRTFLNQEHQLKLLNG